MQILLYFLFKHGKYGKPDDDYFWWIDASELFLDNSIKWQDIRIIFNIVFLIFIEIKEQNNKIFLKLITEHIFLKKL